jgi:hypothetical protein
MLGCSAGYDDSELALEGDPESAEDALRIAGTTTSPTSTTPWSRRPIAFPSIVYAGTASTFDAEQAAAQGTDVDHFPSILVGAKGSSSTRYAGVWHKASKVTDWYWDKRITESTAQAKWDARVAEGFELFDYSVFLEGTTQYYNTVWVKRGDQKPFASKRGLSSSELSAELTTRRAAGYRIKRLQEYKIGGTTRYIGLWTKDGITDVVTATGKSSSELLSLNTTYANQGYTISDISAFNNGSAIVYSGVWTKNPEVRTYAYDSSMDQTTFQGKYEKNLAKGLVLVDLNLFYDTSGAMRYAAIWHRTETSNTLEANFTLPPATVATIQGQIATYEGDATNVGPDGRFGFFVQDLVNGNWIGYNMNEPFYMASTSKFLIAAKVVDDNVASWQQVSLRASDWRGAINPPFCFNPPVCNTFNGTSFALNTFLTTMLKFSDSAATDRLWGLVDTNAPGSLQAYLRDDLGLQNVGEVTTICELDKRIQLPQDPCVRDVTCAAFENWRRNAGGPAPVVPTTAEQACLNKLSNASRADFNRYYATLANSITPVEYGRAIRALMSTALTTTERGRFLQVLDDLGNDDSYDVGRGVDYQEMGTKGGGKTGVDCQVGVMWDWAGAPGIHTSVTPRYGFAIFAEQFANGSYNARPVQRTVLDSVVKAL